MAKKLRIIILEDNPADVELIRRELSKGGVDYISVDVENKHDFCKELNDFNPDLILSDYNLPTYDGSAALIAANNLCPLVPFIFVSGVIGEEMAIETLKQGATDYVLKNRLSRLLPSIDRALCEAEEKKKRKWAENALLENEKRFRSIYENTIVGLYRSTPNGDVLMANPSIIKMLGYSSFEELAKINIARNGFISKSQRAEFQKRMEKEGQILAFESEWTIKDGKKIWVIESSRAVKNEFSKIQYYEGVVEDITERKEAEHALKESERALRESTKKHSTHLQKTPVAYIEWDSDFKVSEWNSAAEKTFGFTKKEAMGKHASELIVPKSERRQVENLWKDLLKQKGGTHSINENFNKNGESITCEWNNTPLTDNNGAIIGVASLVQDITERIVAEKAIKKGAHDLGERVKELKGLYGTSQLVADSNKTLNEVFQGTVDLIPSSWQYPETTCASITYEGEVFRTANWKKTKWSHSSEIATNTGTEITIEVGYLEEKPEIDEGPFLKEERNLIDTLARILADFIDRKLAEAALNESEEKVRALVETSQDWIWELDLKGIHTFSNPAVEEILGYSLKEIIGKSCLGLMHPEDRKQIEIHLLKWIEQKIGWKNQIIRWRHKDGSWRWLESNAVPILDDEGNLSGFRGVDRDITERKQAEKDLQRYKIILEKSSDLAYMTDAKGNVSFLNKAFEKLSGHKREEFIGKSFSPLFDGDELKKAINAYSKTLKGESIKFELSFKDTGVLIEYKNSPLKNETGKTIGVIGVGRNITERKQAEEALKESEEKYRLIVENAHDGIEITQNDQIIFVNFRFAEMLGYTVDELNNSSFSQICTEKAIQDLLGRQKNREDIQQVPNFFETTYRKKDGTIIDVDIKYEIIDYKGIPATFAIIRDITDRNKALHALIESETKFKQLFADLPDAIFVNEFGEKNAGQIIDVNPEAEKQTGFSRMELIGKNITELLAKLDDNKYKFDEKMLNDGEIIRLTEEKKRKDGSTYWTQVQITTIEYEGKKCVLSVNRDVSDLVEAEEELQKYRENLEELVKERTFDLEQSHLEVKKLSQAVEQSPASAVITDPDGKIEYINPTFTEVTGYTEKEVIGKKPNILNSGHHPRSHFKNLWDTILSGKIWRGEIKNKKKNGEFYWESTYISPIMNEQKEIINYVAVKQEITDQKLALEELVKSEKELQIAKEKAESATQAKSDFLANMSHEIRTPMNAILGLNYLLQKSKLTPEQQNYIISQENSAKNLLGIINDILDFSKIEAGKLIIESVGFDLNEVLTNLSDMIRIKARTKKLELIFNIDPDLSGNLYGDPLRLTQILLNLVSNAIKFTEQGEVVLTTNIIKQTTTNAQIKFSISDTGIGMTSKQQEGLFKPFIQADASISRKFGGTGLGLTISSRMVEMMGGEIGAISKSKQGSTFYFSLPFKKVPKKKIEIISEDLSSIKLLVVDDNIHVQEIYGKIFQAFGMTSNAVSDGKQAIRELERIKQSDQKGYDLIVLDWFMPVMNGEDTIHEIVNKNLFDPNRIIITSGFIDEFDAEKSGKLGIKRILQKPVSPSMLYDSIMNIIRPDKKTGIIRKNETKAYLKLAERKILLVEDQEVNQLVARDLLQSEGMKVDIANNGAIAIKKIKKESYDAVLMDLQMPVMDGYEATRKIRKFKQSEKLPIIAMTADAILGVKEKCLKSGMDDFVTKPIEPKTLFSTLNKWIKTEDKKKSHVKKRAATKNEKHKSYPQISFINTKDGVERLNGNVETYINIVLKFRKNNLKTLELLKNNIKANKIEEAEKLVHAIKGVSGNISAEKLFNICTTLDNVLKHNKIDQISDEMKKFEKELNRVLHSIENYENQLEIHKEKKVVDTVVDIDIDQEMEGLKPILKELEQSLKENNMKSKTLLATLKEKAQSAQMLEVVKNLSDYLENYNFDEAYRHIIEFNKQYLKD